MIQVDKTETDLKMKLSSNLYQAHDTKWLHYAHPLMREKVATEK